MFYTRTGVPVKRRVEMPIDPRMRLAGPTSVILCADESFSRFEKLARLALDVPTAHVVLAGEEPALADARAHAAAPVLSADGEVLGVFVVADEREREWTAAELEILDTIAAA